MSLDSATRGNEAAGVERRAHEDIARSGTQGTVPAMLEMHVARDRAVRRAIETGEMPNFDLIHTIQKTEGYSACFGRSETFCGRVVCRWYPQCMALSTFRPKSTPTAARPIRRRLEGIPPAQTGVYRDGMKRVSRAAEAAAQAPAGSFA